jgi:hypothetical protein
MFANLTKLGRITTKQEDSYTAKQVPGLKDPFIPGCTEGLLAGF